MTLREEVANPYAAPQAASPAVAGRRLPLGPSLAGLLVAMVATVAMHYAVLPVVAMLEQATFGYWDFPPAPLEIILPAGLVVLFWGIFGTPAVLVGWRLNWLSPRSALLAGIAMMAIGVVFLIAAIFARHHDSPELLYESISLAVMIKLWLFTPLLAGFGSYAWWLMKLRRMLPPADKL
ncbi:MAG: hypothetical protein AAGF31_06375 [Planctomycetota bacterium]